MDISKFAVGCKVVCLEDRYFAKWKPFGFNLPKKNEIYTVRTIAYYNESHYKGYAIRLMEVVNPIYVFLNCTEEVSFRIRFFVPLDDYLNTISIQELLEEPAVMKAEV